VVSFGEQRPDCSDKTEECWSRNRRAHFVLKAQ
jgi:outer membrane protein OmpA-like peptidoglycan-associated protein